MTYTDVATRALVVSMKCPFGGKTSVAIAAKTGLSVGQIDRIYARAIAKECEEKLPNSKMLVQEDKAPAYAHWIQQEVYDAYNVQRLLWPGNSPDLNAIECAWEWMKRYITKEGRHSSRNEAIRAWERSWAELPQAQIQAWIERIPRHV